MPAWYELPLEDRLAVIQYVKYELTADRSDPTSPYFYFVDEPPGPPLPIGRPPPPTAEMVAHGGEIWLQAKCWECHGKAGKGDGEKAAGLKDELGFPIVPANLTRGLFKSGPKVEDIFRTISIGLIGTPMPSFQASFPEADRWALAYYILSLSAYTDPLTGAPLPSSPADHAARDEPSSQLAGADGPIGRVAANAPTALLRISHRPRMWRQPSELAGRVLAIAVVAAARRRARSRPSARNILFRSERPPVGTAQLGYRGTGLVNVYNPRDREELVAGQSGAQHPCPMPAMRARRPGASMRTSQVLGDVSTGEFTRLMVNITEWVAPEQGCAACHNVENFADDSLYTKVVARRMLQMVAPHQRELDQARRARPA